MFMLRKSKCIIYDTVGTKGLNILIYVGLHLGCSFWSHFVGKNGAFKMLGANFRFIVWVWGAGWVSDLSPKLNKKRLNSIMHVEF